MLHFFMSLLGGGVAEWMEGRWMPIGRHDAFSLGCTNKTAHTQGMRSLARATDRLQVCGRPQTAERYAVVRKTQSKRSSANLLTRKANRARQ